MNIGNGRVTNPVRCVRVAPQLTCRDADADLVEAPSAPVTVNWRFPFLELDVTVAVSVDWPVPPAIDEVPAKLSEIPVVAPLELRLTVPLYPALAVTVTV